MQVETRALVDVSGLPEPIADEIRRLVEMLRAQFVNGATPMKHAREMSIEEFDKLLDEALDGLPELPSLPPDFSRADIYAEHD